MGQTESIKLEDQLCFPLYACAREIVKTYRPVLDALGLTYTQYIAMLVLWEDHEVSVKDLGYRLHLDSGTLTPLLKKLEEKGFMSRERSTRDERVVIASITVEGRQLQEKAAAVPALIRQQFQDFTAKEVNQMYRLLYRLMEVLEQNNQTGAEK